MNCCKPFKGAKCNKKLAKVTPSIANKISKLKDISNINHNKIRICSSCSIKLRFHKFEEQPSVEANISPPASSLSSSSSFVTSDESSTSAEETLLKKRIKIEQEKEDQTLSKLSESSIVPSSPKTLSPKSSSPTHEKYAKAVLYDEMMSQLKCTYGKLTTSKEKVHLLTVLPKSMPESDIAKDFQCSSHLVKVAKELQLTQGILSFPEGNNKE